MRSWIGEPFDEIRVTPTLGHFQMEPKLLFTAWCNDPEDGAVTGEAR